MRKIEILDMVQDFLSGGDAPADIRGKYHPKIIHNLTCLACNTIIVNLYKIGKEQGNLSILDAWARNYPISIVSSNRVALPYPPMSLPDGMGILQVANGRDSGVDYTNVYAYRDTNANAVFAALEVGNSNISSKPYFYLEINNSTGINSHVLILGNIPAQTTGVTVKMVVPLDQVDDYSHVSIPDEGGSMIITSVIELLRQKPAEDYINDNKVNQI